MPVPILVLRTLPRKHGGGEKVRNALQADYPTEMMSGGTLAIGRCVSTFYLSQFFTSSGINLCPGSRIAFPTTLCHCVDAGYAQDKKQEETNMTIDSAKDLQMKGS